MSFTYLAYGLGIRSSLAVPEFLAATTEPEVVIRLAENHERLPLLPQGQAGPHFKLTPREAVLPIEAVGVFQVRRGREIIISAPPERDEAGLRLYLVGNIMGLVHYQRGALVLHAGAAAVDGSAVAFVGLPGAGKTSLAAALYRQGCPLVTDDVLPARPGPEGVTVYPGSPQLKLNWDVAQLLGCPPERLHRLHPQQDKWGCPVRESYRPDPLPLRRVYVLSRESPPGLEPLGPQAAVIELIRHTFPTRFGRAGGKGHFEQCARLARQVSFYRLRRGDDLAALPQVARLVLAHLAGAE